MFKNKLTELLKEAKKNGVSQQKLADHLGVKKSRITDWKSGRTSPKKETIAKIAKFFNVTTDYLLKTDEAPNDNNQNFGNHNTIITGSDNQLSNFNNSLPSGSAELTPEESEFIKIYRSLNGANRLKLLAFISSLSNEKQTANK